MYKAVIIIILFCIIGFGVGYCIRQYHTNSSLHGRTYIKDVSHDRKCESGICPPIEENKNIK